jgi:hypothetical protein
MWILKSFQQPGDASQAELHAELLQTEEKSDRFRVGIQERKRE